MGVIIDFPKLKAPQFKTVRERIGLLNEEKPIDTSIFSEEESKAFISLVSEWPCFQCLEPGIPLQEIFELYYDDELSQSQDCVLEFIFHMHDPDSCFDISNALYNWDEADREHFFSSLKMHAELIDIVKQEEEELS